LLSSADRSASDMGFDKEKQVKAEEGNVAIEAKVVIEAKVINVVSGMCYQLGVFEKKWAVNEVLARGEMLNYVGKIIMIGKKSISDYWVYISADANKKITNMKHKELLKRKIDNYIVASGALKDAISLGLFKNEQNAYDFQNKIKKLGYRVKIKEVGKGGVRYWAEFAVREGFDGLVRKKIYAETSGVAWFHVECSEK
jgi:hypothetical protein